MPSSKALRYIDVGFIHDFGGSIDVRIGMRETHHKRRCNHSLPDEFLQEQRPEGL